jgi:prepilin signal peptidase PulO-like enzyme (type II secretory pathway)
MGYICLGIISAWFGAPPLLAWARRLLATVPQTEAAPIALATPGATNALGHGAATPHLAPALSNGWAASLRWVLLALLPLTAWRGAALAHHLAPWVAALVLLACVALLALAAIIDASAHLIFAEMLSIPAALGVLAGLAAGDWASLLIGGAVGGGILGILYLGGQVLYGTDALGWGDVQLGVALGLLLGWQGTLRALVWGMLLLTAVTLVLLAARRITTRSFVPLGSYLMAAAVASLLLMPPPWL